MNPQTIYSIISVAFGAGGAYVLIQQSRKDVNGLGRKMNREISRSARRFQNVTVALMLLADDHQRDRVADLLRESGEDAD